MKKKLTSEVSTGSFTFPERPFWTKFEALPLTFFVPHTPTIVVIEAGTFSITQSFKASILLIAASFFLEYEICKIVIKITNEFCGSFLFSQFAYIASDSHKC